MSFTTTANAFRRCGIRCRLQVYRHLSSDSKMSETVAPKVTRTRRRHKFGVSLSAIPSLHDFQQQAQTRSLYRKFMRIAYNQHMDAAREFRSQIRTEFRKGNADTARALSEGTRRLKEVQAMIGTAKDRQSQTIPAKKEWPWNNIQKRHKPPLQFPPKNTR